MLNENKIENAANKYLNNWIINHLCEVDDVALTFVNYPQTHKEINELNKESFKKGATWGFSEYKKLLWHNKRECPEKGKTYVYCDITGYLFTENTTHEDWSSFVEEHCILRWLYLDDILPYTLPCSVK